MATHDNKTRRRKVGMISLLLVGLFFASVAGAIVSHYRHLRAMAAPHQPLVRSHQSTTSVPPSTTA